MPGVGIWHCSPLKQRRDTSEHESSSYDPSWGSVNVASSVDDYWHLTYDKTSECSQYAALLSLDTCSKASGEKKQIYVTAGDYFQIDSSSKPPVEAASPSKSFSTSSSSSSWRTAGSEELAALVAKKSMGCLSNCDLPTPTSSPVASSSASSSSSPKIIGKASTVPAGFAKPSSTKTPNSSTRNEYQQQQQCLSTGSSWLGGELLGEALCRSQTRAREAEKVAVQAFQDKDKLMRLFLREASVSFAYRQWLISLQAENLCLKMCQAAKRPPAWASSYAKKRKWRREHQESSTETLIMRCTLAFALGLGLASAGLLLGWGIGWILFAAA